MQGGAKRSSWILLGLVGLLLGLVGLLLVQVAWAADHARAGNTQGSPSSRFSQRSSSNAAAVLWDQPAGASGRAVLSQDLMQDHDYFDVFSADDFTNDKSWWTIKTIFVAGDTWSDGCDLTCAETLHWAIYADDSGRPDGDPSGGGNQPVWEISVAPANTQVTLSKGSGGWLSDVTLDLKKPVSLQPGAWWLVVYADLSRDTCGCNYGPNVADTTNGHVAQIINPGGAWGIPTTWTSIQVTTTLGLAEHDLAFRLQGQEVPVQDVYLPLVIVGR